MVQLFSEKGLLKKAAVFDTKKLEWMNGQHLSRLSGEALAPLAVPTFVRAGLLAKDDPHARIRRVLHAPRLREGALPHARRPREARTAVFHGAPFSIDSALVESHLRKDAAVTRALLTDATAALEQLGAWTAGAMEPALREVAERHGVAAGKVFQPMRVALTGSTVSPGIFEVLVQLGREVSVKRLKEAAALAS